MIILLSYTHWDGLHSFTDNSKVNTWSFSVFRSRTLIFFAKILFFMHWETLYGVLMSISSTIIVYVITICICIYVCICVYIDNEPRQYSWGQWSSVMRRTKINDFCFYICMQVRADSNWLISSIEGRKVCVKISNMNHFSFC